MDKEQNTPLVPRKTLNELTEFTTGFLLVARDEAGEFRTFVDLADSSTELAFIQYLDLQIDVRKEHIKSQCLAELMFQDLDDITPMDED